MYETLLPSILDVRGVQGMSEPTSNMYTNQHAKPSILDKKGPRSTTIMASETARYTVLAIMLILILLFWLWVFTKLKQNAPKPSYFLQCPTGQCATNIYNGEKRCLDDSTTSIIYDPTFEVCNSKGACENRRTKYAVQEDGSTNVTGLCPPGITCRCLEKPRCPNNVVVTFSSINGTLEGGLNANATNSTVIIQGPQLIQGDTGIPLDFDSNITQFCALRPRFLNRMAPRTKECNFNEAPTYNEMLACIKSEPCTIGRIVFKPLSRNGYQFKMPPVKQKDGSVLVSPNMSVPIACVARRRGQVECGPSKVPVWDYVQDTIVCMS